MLIKENFNNIPLYYYRCTFLEYQTISLPSFLMCFMEINGLECYSS